MTIQYYNGYKIKYVSHPTIFHSKGMAWDIYSNDESLKKANFASLETAKRTIDLMIACGMWNADGDTKKEK